MSWTIFTPPLVLLLIGAVMCYFGNTRPAGKGLLTAGIAMSGMITMLVEAVVIMMMTTSVWILLAAELLTAAVAAALICTVWGVIKKKMVRVCLAACAVLCLAVIGGVSGYEAWRDSIPTVGESDSLLWEYRPFGEQSKVALLDEPSELRFEEGEELPRMDGATALYPIYSAFARAAYPESSTEGSWMEQSIVCSTTVGAYEYIVTGEADIIFAAAPSQEQLDFAAQNGVELVLTPIGREAFVFFVNGENPMNNITVEQIQGIYSGEITKWKQLGVDGLGAIRPLPA